MQPGTLNIAFTRGDGYTLELTFTDNQDPPVALDYSGMTFAAQLRRFEDDTIAVDFSIDDSDSDTGIVVLSLTAVETAELERAYAWDLELTDGADVPTTILAGTVAVKPDVTRAPVP